MLVRIWANNTLHNAGDYQTYAVSADGKRILLLQMAGQAGGASGAIAMGPDTRRPYLTVAMNWASALKK